MDSDEKRQGCFRRGLNTKLQDKLALTTCANFTELVNKAITQEDATVAHKADKKRKHQLDLPTVHRRDIGWCRQRLNKLQVALCSQVVGLLGRHSSRQVYPVS